MSKSLALTWTSVALLGGVILWGWSVDPHPFARWGLVPLVLLALWGYVERAQPGDRAKERQAVVRWHRLCVAWASLMLAFSVGFQVGVAADIFRAEWAPVIVRIRGVIFGVSMMVWGNYLPKLASPWRLDHQPFDWQGVHRFVGWGASLAGLAVVLAWLTMAPAEARSVMQIVVALTAGLALGRKLLSLRIPGDGAKASCR